MKKSFCLFLLTLSAFFYLQAQKCKPFSETTGEDGKSYVVYGLALSTFSLKYAYDEFYPYVFLYNDGSASSVALQLNFSHKATKVEYDGKPVPSYELGTSFELFFENGESIYVKSTSSEKSTKGALDLIVILSARIQNQDIARLGSNKLEKIKVSPYLDNKDFFFIDVKKKRGEKLLNQFSCFNNMNYDNSAKELNPRKAETYLKLADKYITSKKYNKALEYYQKSDEVYPNPFSKSKLAILNVFLDNDISKNLDAVKGHLESVKKLEGSQENIKLIEELVLALIEANPDLVEMEELLLLVAE